MNSDQLPEQHRPVPPVVWTFGVFIIVHIIIGHQQIFAFELVFVVICHVWANATTVFKKKKEEEIRVVQQKATLRLT